MPSADQRIRWYVIGSRPDAPFGTPWGHYSTIVGGVYRPVRFGKVPGTDLVMVNGLAAYTTTPAGGSTIFQLPKGCWPEFVHIFPARTGNTTARVDVNPDGRVIYNAETAVLNYLSLDGLIFEARS